MATDDEVSAQAETVASLRAMLEEARQAGADKLKEAENDQKLVGLQAEEARLMAELAEVMQHNELIGVKSNTGSASDAMAAAMEHQKQVAAKVTGNKSKPASETAPAAAGEGE